MRYRKKPIEVEATQWFQSGDHPEDDREWFQVDDDDPFLGEGKIVRYYRHPDDDWDRACEKCGVRMQDHGWIDTLEGGHVVCPGDWIITGVYGEHYPVKHDIFDATYGVVEDGPA